MALPGRLEGDPGSAGRIERVGWVVCDMKMRAGHLVVAGLTSLALLVGLEAHAAFEIEPITPAERGAVAGAALGIANRSLDGTRPAPDRWCPRCLVAVYGFRPFGCDEIDFGSLRIDFPLGASRYALGLAYRRLKAGSYLEETYAASCTAHLEKIRIEPTVRFGTLRWDGRWLDWAVLVDVDAEVWIGSRMRFHVRLTNPFSLGLAGEGSRCPVRVSVGMGCPVLPALALGVEVRKQAGRPTAVLTGVEWVGAGRLSVRTGLGTYPERLGLGIGVSVGRVTVDVGTSLDLELGATHQVGASFAWR